MIRRAPLVVPVTLLALLAGCGDPRTALQDEAACPGASCTDDVQERFDALAALDRVTAVERVERSDGLDRGSSRSATLTARVEDREAARDVALEALRLIEDWPDHDAGSATVTVASDPEVTVEYVGRSVLDMSRAPFEPCPDSGCEATLAEVRDQVTEDYDGVEDLRLDVTGDVLRVSATTSADQVELVARGVQRALVVAGARVAARARVEVSGRGPLVMTLRLDEGLVCEQPLGTRESCEQDNSEVFDN